jgi:hypothetical protein
MRTVSLLVGLVTLLVGLGFLTLAVTGVTARHKVADPVVVPFPINDVITVPMATVRTRANRIEQNLAVLVHLTVLVSKRMSVLTLPLSLA